MKNLVALLALFALPFAAACGDNAEGPGDTTSDPSPCEDVSCSGHGDCALEQNEQVRCICDEGYEAQGTECIAETDPCDGVDCSDAGECVTSQDGQAQCICDEGFEVEGTECVASTNACDEVDCSGFGECELDQNDLASCTCEEGYEAEGTACIAIDFCEGIDCSGHGECMVENFEAVCACDRGYEADGTTCERTLDYIFEGTFTPGPASTSQTDAFEAIEGVELQFFVGFNTRSIRIVTPSSFGRFSREYTTNNVTFWLGAESALSTEGQAIVDTIIADFQGRAHSVNVRVSNRGNETFSFNNLKGTRGEEYFGMEISEIPLDLGEDEEGDAVLVPFSDQPASINLRRYSEPGDPIMTDRSDGSGVFSHW